MGADAAGDHGEAAPRSPVVTLAALYEAGGSVVGPRVAERLGVELLDRKVPVYLGRPRDARIRQGMTLEGIDRETAERRQEAEEGAPIRLIVAASRARRRAHP